MRLFHKVLITIVLSTAILLGLSTWLFYRSVNIGFVHYIESVEKSKLDPIAARLAEWHTQDPGWRRIGEHPALLRDLSRSGAARPGRTGTYRDHARRPPRARDGRHPPPGHRRPPPDGRRPPPDGRRPPPPPPDLLGIGVRLGLFDIGRQYIAGDPAPFNESLSRPILDGETVLGWLSLAPLDGFENRLEQAFPDRDSQ